MTEKRMLERIKNGERDLLDELCGKYYGDVYRYCLYRTGSVADAEDLTQECFLRIWRYLGSRELPQKFKPYLLKTASNICTDYLSRRQVVTELDERIPDTSSHHDNEKDIVRRTIASLGDDAREVIVLYYYSGMKLNDISQTLGIPLSTVKTRIRRARIELKELLIKNGF